MNRTQPSLSEPCKWKGLFRQRVGIISICDATEGQTLLLSLPLVTPTLSNAVESLHLPTSMHKDGVPVLCLGTGRLRVGGTWLRTQHLCLSFQ